MPAINDYLLRALDRGHISRQEYEAGRDWQALESDAAAGNPAAKDKLDALDLDSKCSLGWKRHQLIRDVLLCEESPRLPSALARAASKRGLNPTTGSRDMKRLGRELRCALRRLAVEVAIVTKDVHQRTEERRAWSQEYLENRGALEFTQGARPNGIAISTPCTDKLERKSGPSRAWEQMLYSVREVAAERGFLICPSLDEDGEQKGAEQKDGLFDVFTSDGQHTNYQNRGLSEIEAALKRLPVQQRRKPGARGRAPVTLPKINV